ncbi:hypothetical protein [Sphingomonas sp. ID0503]|uniref:hypothetical protein n=1 Tax=Sphingomonas sp. ID0503 TaxID=3399691 RepID=UPI003AFAF2D0
MADRIKWKVDGTAASQRDMKECVLQAKRHRACAVNREREIAQLDRDARAVGAVLRRLAREKTAKTFPLRCRPRDISGRRKGTLRSRAFEQVVGLGITRPSHVASDGFSSFHFRLSSRGLGSHRKAAGRPYVQGEAVRAVRYIMRDAAREIEGGGIVSNISADPDKVAGVFDALEELERVAGDRNGNVYISIVVSLPHELHDREDLLRQICAPLEADSLAYAAVLHRPDLDGDQRNFHAHILSSVRQIRLEDDDEISFSALKASELNDTVYITELREHIATVMNAAMEREGHCRRFTAKSRAARRLELPDPIEAKHSPGRKHRDRRAAAIAAAKTERSALKAMMDGVTRLKFSLEAILTRSISTRGETLGKFEEFEREMKRTAAVAHAQRSAPSKRTKTKRKLRYEVLLRVVQDFRMTDAYTSLEQSERVALDLAMQYPLQRILAGTAALRIIGDEPEAAVSATVDIRAFRSLASSDAGRALLRAAAEALSAPDAPPGSWQQVAPSDEIPLHILAALQRGSPARH